MPPIDVNLITPSDTWSTWGPPIITALGGALVAIITLIGVLRAANKSAKAAQAAAETSATAAREAAERSAQTVLDAEYARAQNEERRHLRELLANVVTAALERSFYLANLADIQCSETHHLWTDEKKRAITLTSTTLTQGRSLAIMTTTSAEIRTALASIGEADSYVSRVRASYSGDPAGDTARRDAIVLATERLDEAANALAQAASERLATPPS
ncbi:hypothetical protein [Isoptericola sp. NPDC056134]|uniref:hypothetical protein n=1 Tax=Isoptericola sp. NPDC056134 TaxID=3345723 RepID=UPI0035E8268C